MSPMFLQFANEMQPTEKQQFSTYASQSMPKPWFGGAPSSCPPFNNSFFHMKPQSDNRSMMMALVSSQFDAMLESEEAHKREIKLRHEYELDASRKQNMQLRKHLFLLNMQQSSML